MLIQYKVREIANKLRLLELQAKNELKRERRVNLRQQKLREKRTLDKNKSNLKKYTLR